MSTLLSRGNFVLNCAKTAKSLPQISFKLNQPGFTLVRNYKQQWVYPHLKEINRRREAVETDQKLRSGKVEIPRRSEFTDWNYNSELVAFQARLGEKFDESKLREAFITAAYTDSLNPQLEEMEIEPNEKLLDNSKLAEQGKKVIDETLTNYIRWALPHLPQEGVEAIKDYLTTPKLLAHVSFHIGTLDLIMTPEYPPNVETMSSVFEALIGALASSDRQRSCKLVLDLVATQLDGKDLTDIWDIRDPMKTLATFLAKDGKEKPESRLLWASGKDTILACYYVGIYSNKQLLGQAPGETPEIAEDLATRDALKRLFKLDTNPLPFGKQAEPSINK